MKKFGHSVSLLIILVLLNGYITNAQEINSCKVLLEPISGSYDGDCKNGLAHGKGIAQGIDKYEGKFKEGLPNGNGKYTWANGDYFDGNWKASKKDGKGTLFTVSSNSKLLGYWKDDSFVKEITEPPYKILQMTGASSVTIQEKQGGVSGSVELIFSRDGREVREFNDLMLGNSSGSAAKSSNYVGFDSVSYPFEGSATFSAMNKVNSNLIRYYIKFIINKEGSWKVIVKY